MGNLAAERRRGIELIEGDGVGGNRFVGDGGGGQGGGGDGGGGNDREMLALAQGMWMGGLCLSVWRGV